MNPKSMINVALKSALIFAIACWMMPLFALSDAQDERLMRVPSAPRKIIPQRKRPKPTPTPAPAPTPVPTPTPMPSPTPTPGNSQLPITFSLTEQFGVSHGDQIIDFDLPGNYAGKNLRMTGSDGNQVPFQLLSGNKVGVRVEGGLQANSTKSWTLSEGASTASARSDEVKLLRSGNVYELTNGLTGVRVIATLTAGQSLAPIQGVRYRNGTWTATGPNLLKDGNETLTPKSAAVTILEQGPIKTTIKVEYRIDRPDYVYSDIHIPGGEKFYTSIITLEAGQPSVLFTEDSDMELEYSLNVTSGLSPNEARYGGSYASSITNGRHADGSLYQAYPKTNEEALVNLPFTEVAADGGIRFLTRWSPWATDTGHYWQLYKRGAANSANLFGAFNGPASQTIGANFSGTYIFSTSSSSTGVAVSFNRRGPDNRVSKRNRYAWALFTGTKSDLAAPNTVQTIGKQMNLHGGINLNKVHRYVVSYADPSGGTQGLYMNRAQLQAMIQRLRSGSTPENCEGYWGTLFCGAPEYRELWYALADSSGAKARELIAPALAEGRRHLDNLVNGWGIYTLEIHYWKGGAQLARNAQTINMLSILGEMDASVFSAAERAQLKKIAALYGYILWDDDFVPLFDTHALPMGTENMAIQQQSYRDLYTLMLAHHPYFGPKAAGVRQRATNLLYQTINEQGAAIGSSNYISTAVGPLLDMFQQLKTAGVWDAFAAEPRLAKFADFYLNLMTPPEIRFNGKRKLVSFGDGTTSNHGSELLGQLGTAFRGINLALSEQLMAAWKLVGSSVSGFTTSGAVKIDAALPERPLNLGDKEIPGYYGVVRHGFGQSYETAAWLVNGTWYRDHATCDLGGLAIYARGVPISLNWGSIYYPHVPGAWMRNVVVPESSLNAGWDTEAVSLTDCFGIRQNQQVISNSLQSSAAMSKVAGEFNMSGQGTWARTIYDYKADPASPVVRIKDVFGGGWLGQSKIFTLNLFAQGAVRMPDGSSLTPPTRPVNVNQGAGAPTVSAVKNFGAGVSNLRFSGQLNSDFDVFLVSVAGGQVYVGNWAHSFSYTPEADDYWYAYNGASFEERQHILRVKSAGNFDVVIIPYAKGQRPTDLSLVRNGATLTLTMNQRTYQLGD
jgi:hypothetical protein